MHCQKWGRAISHAASLRDSSYCPTRTYRSEYRTYTTNRVRVARTGRSRQYIKLPSISQ